MKKNMTVEEMIRTMTTADLDKLYFALLHIKEADQLGDGLLKDLYKMVCEEALDEDFVKVGRHL